MHIARSVVACLTAGSLYVGTAQARPSVISFAPEQMTLTTGAGLSDFVFSSMRGTTRAGVGWDVRAMFGARSILAFEAGYTGQFNTLTQDRTATFTATVSPYLLQTSVDGALRINILPWRVQPYLFGGLGYNHTDVHRRADDPTIGLRFHARDDQLLIPSGAGLSVYLGRQRGLALDARFTYRALFATDFMTTGPDPRLDQYSAALRIGARF